LGLKGGLGNGAFDGRRVVGGDELGRGALVEGEVLRVGEMKTIALEGGRDGLGVAAKDGLRVGIFVIKSS
jgi:hypothetical protein